MPMSHLKKQFYAMLTACLILSLLKADIPTLEIGNPILYNTNHGR